MSNNNNINSNVNEYKLTKQLFDGLGIKHYPSKDQETAKQYAKIIRAWE